MPAYPASIPFFTARDGYRETGPEATIRTDMSTGPAKVRRRFTAAPRRVSARIAYLTAAELATFESFFETTIAMGSLSFTAENPITGTTRTYRFVGSYDVEPRGVGYTVSAELEILP